MGAPSGSPSWLAVHTAAERPDPWDRVRRDDLFAICGQEYNHHGNHTPTYFGRWSPRFAEYQALIVDRRSDRIVARGRTIPFRWNGNLEDLPAGVDAHGLRAVEDDDPQTALSALAAEVSAASQGSGLSRGVIATMVAMAQNHGLHPLVAPIRPTRKDRYPLAPIDRDATWRRSDALPFDPWMRVLVRSPSSDARGTTGSPTYGCPTPCRALLDPFG